MSKSVENNILSPEQWLRILLMIAFGILSWVLRFLQIIVAVIQALFALVTGRDNLNLRRVGTTLSLYQAHIWLYLSYSTDTRPFPFNDLPQSADELVIDPAVHSPSDTEPEPQDVGGEGGQSQEDDVFSDISFTAQENGPEQSGRKEAPSPPVPDGETGPASADDGEPDDTEENKP